MAKVCTGGATGDAIAGTEPDAGPALAASVSSPATSVASGAGSLRLQAERAKAESAASKAVRDIIADRRLNSVAVPADRLKGGSAYLRRAR